MPTIAKKSFFIFALAMIVRVFYVWFFVDSSNLELEDQMMYIQLGKIMAETGNFLQYASNGYVDVTERLPGYPAFLAVIYTLFGENNMIVVAVQIFIDSLTCVIIALITKLVTNKGFMFAGMISVFNLNMIVLSGMVLTDTLFLFFFSLFILIVFSYLKKPNSFKLFLSVAMLCISILVRPVSYYLIVLLLPFVIIFLIYNKIDFKQILYSSILYVIPVVLALGSTHYRNFNEYNSFLIVSQGGAHALYWVVPAAYQYSGQGSYQDGQTLARDKLIDIKQKDRLKKSSVDSVNNQFEDSNYQMQIARGILTEFGTVNILKAWSVGTVVNLLTPSIAYAPVVRAMKHQSFYETPGNGAVSKILNYITNTSSFIYLSVIIIGTIFSLLFFTSFILGLYGMIKSKKMAIINREIIIFSLLIIFYFIAVTGPIIGVKYRLPIEPLMTIFVSYMLFRIKYKGTLKE